MTGNEYEKLCASYLKAAGYRNIEFTKKSGDQGIDIIAERHGIRYGFQCKHYQSPVGNKAVQEAAAGVAFYGLDEACVITSSLFTPAAVELAEANGIELWEKQTEERLALKILSLKGGLATRLLFAVGLLCLAAAALYALPATDSFMAKPLGSGGAPLLALGGLLCMAARWMWAAAAGIGLFAALILSCLANYGFKKAFVPLSAALLLLPLVLLVWQAAHIFRTRLDKKRHVKRG